MIKSPIFSAALVCCAAIAPGIASADFVLDTGTPPSGGASVLLNTVNWYAAEFSVTAGTDITSLAAYLTQGSGQVGDTYTWDIYSTSGTFFGANREPYTYTATGKFTVNGWNTTSVNWVPTTSGNYWVALQVSSTSQTRGLDLTTESSVTSGTAPAIAFAYAGTNNRYAADTSTGVGIEVSTTPVPLPASAWLFAGGLLGFGALRRRNGSAARGR
jgi:hypothetical protein